MATLMLRASISASRLKVSSILACTWPGLTFGVTMMLLLMPTTPRTCWTINSTSSRWYCHSTSPLSVTPPARTCACTLPSGIWVLLSRCARSPGRCQSRRAHPLPYVASGSRGSSLALCPHVVDLLEVSPEGQQPVPDGRCSSARTRLCLARRALTGQTSRVAARSSSTISTTPWDVVLLQWGRPGRLRETRPLPVSRLSRRRAARAAPGSDEPEQASTFSAPPSVTLRTWSGQPGAVWSPISGADCQDVGEHGDRLPLVGQLGFGFAGCGRVSGAPVLEAVVAVESGGGAPWMRPCCSPGGGDASRFLPD